MRVSIVSCVFPPEPYNVSSNIRDLAKELTDRGHIVTVICPYPNRPFGHLMDGFQSGWLNEQQQDGYRILRCWHLISRKSTFLSRFAENASFGITSSWRLLRESRPDVVYLFNWTIFAEGLNSKLLHHLGIPFVSCTRDIHPESLVLLGRLAPRSLTWRALLHLNIKHLHRCSHLVTLNHGMAAHLARTRGLAREKMSVVPVWSTGSRTQMSPRYRNAIRSRMGVASNHLWVVYAGSLGFAPGLELYVQAAKLLKYRQDIQLQLIGSGPMRDILHRQIMAAGLTNICVTDSASMSDSFFHELQSAADVLLLPLPEAMSNLCAPSKLTTYLLAGRPVLASVGATSGTGQTIAKANAGAVLPSGDAYSVANKLVEIADHPSLLDALGSNAIQYAETYLSLSHVLGQLVDLLESVAESSVLRARETRTILS